MKLTDQHVTDTWIADTIQAYKELVEEWKYWYESTLKAMEELKQRRAEDRQIGTIDLRLDRD